MPLIYITGPSGAGKSTIRNELLKRGYEAHDTDDDGMSRWYDNQTLKPVDFPKANNRPEDWFEKHSFRLSEERVKELAARAKTKLIFLCGIPANDNEFRGYYDKVICLVIDQETMKHRVATRTTNGFGKSPDELQLMLYWHGKMLERYKDWGAAMVDASLPVDDVVGEVLRAAESNRDTQQAVTSSPENKRYNDEVILLDGLYEFHPEFFDDLSEQELRTLRAYYLTGQDVPHNIFEYRAHLIEENPEVEKDAHAIFSSIRRRAGLGDR